ncbi:MAG: hypothetical protein EPO28_13360 [Saprospiraceae bacterium]|nr:MAG: hypothetical protein EPO28_13360 [Saprospiraceae bacterium]
MKKLLFSLFALALVALASSCNSDSCSFTGKWKVKSADIQSEKLSATILNMAKEELMSTQYEFTKDGKISMTIGESGVGNSGTYHFDSDTQTLTFDTKNSMNMESHLTSTVTACSQLEITLTERQPDDPAKEAIATTIYTLERIQ